MSQCILEAITVFLLEKMNKYNFLDCIPVSNKMCFREGRGRAKEWNIKLNRIKTATNKKIEIQG